MVPLITRPMCDGWVRLERTPRPLDYYITPADLFVFSIFFPDFTGSNQKKFDFQGLVISIFYRALHIRTKHAWFFDLEIQRFYRVLREIEPSMFGYSTWESNGFIAGCSEVDKIHERHFDVRGERLWIR